MGGLKKKGRNSKFTLFGFRVDADNLNLLKDKSLPNFHINKELKIEALFDNIESKIETDFKRP